MKRRITIRMPIEKRGLFGRRKIVYQERTIVVDGRTYRHMQRTRKAAELDDFLGDMEIMDAIFDD